MSFDLYPFILPLYYLFAFIIQKPKIKPVSFGLITVIILAFSQINPNYRDMLLPLLAFLTYFTVGFWHNRHVSTSIIQAALPMIHLFIVFEWSVYFQFPQLWMTVLVTLAILTGLTLLSQSLIRFLNNHWEPSQSYLYIFVIVLFFVLYYRQILLILNYFLAFQDAWILLFQIIYLFIVGLFTFMLVIFNNSNEQIRRIEQEKAQTEISQQYNQLIAQQYDEVRRFRHDYQNMLLSLEGLVKAQDWSTLRIYVDKALEQHQVNHNESQRKLGRLAYLQNADLRNLIYTKLLAAKSLNVAYHIEIADNIHIQSDALHFLPRMLGIILDNAIEAASQITNGELTLAIVEEESISIIVVNSCQADIAPLSLLQQKDYSTKGPGRGIGLHSLNQLLSTTDILLNTEVHHHTFSQELVIPKGK